MKAAALNKRVSLTAPYPQIKKTARRDRITVQYAVREIGRQAGFQYDFEKSLANTDPICRQYITPKIRNKTCREALESILRPVGLTYRTDAGVIVLVRR
ncbi:MAG: STN domain-containing protein [Planctomycetes bacterium]|nr:STN domain-containing protein [Planctomycetota bacterium]